MKRNASINNVFTSKFMLNFAQNLEVLIRKDIKEENGKSDVVLRSLSRAASQNGGFLVEDQMAMSFDLRKKSVSNDPGFRAMSPMVVSKHNYNVNNSELLTLDVQENDRKSGGFTEVIWQIWSMKS